MGNPLTGSTVASTYTSLLKTADTTPFSSTLKTICDGAGNNSKLQVSTLGVKSDGTFESQGAATLSSTLAVTGATTLSSLFTNGNASVDGALNVTGATTLAGLTMTGNLSVPGTLSSTGNFAVNTNKFTVTSASGNTAVAGTLDSAGDFKVATNKFTVAAATGNTAVAGTLGVTGASNLSTLNVSGLSQLAELDALSDTTVGGTLVVTGATTLSSVTASGNAVLNGNLSVAGNTTIGNAAGDLLTVTAGAVTIDNLPSKTTPVDADTVLLRDSAASNALKTATTDSLKVVKLVYSEGISKTGGAGQSISISAGTPYAIQESGSTATWQHTWTPKTVGNKCVIRVAVPLETDTQGSYYVGVTTTPVSAPTSYIGVGSAYASAAAASPVNIIAEMVFTSTAASHTFQMYITGATSNVVIAKNAFGYYFGQTGATLQAKVQFTLMEYA